MVFAGKTKKVFSGALPQKVMREEVSLQYLPRFSLMAGMYYLCKNKNLKL